MKVKELLTDESKWVKRCFARNANGIRVSTTSRGACKFCLLGAIYKCYDPYRSIENWDVVEALVLRIEQYLGVNSIVEWNDSFDRTFEDVKKLVEALDI